MADIIDGKTRAHEMEMARQALSPNELRAARKREDRRALRYWSAFKRGSARDDIPSPGQFVRDALRSKGGRA